MLEATCCCKNVLVWNGAADCEGGSSVPNSVIINAVTHLQDTALTEVHSSDSVGSSDTWSGDIDDYSLLILPVLKATPSWWTSITGATWTGRIFISGEHSAFTLSNAFLNTLTGMTGMGITPALIDPASVAGPVSALDITAGITGLDHAATSEVTGGTSVSTTIGGGAKTWIARNKVAGIDWIYCGDINPMVGSLSPDNILFLQNLVTVDP